MLALTVGLALVTFAIVQDRVTAAAARGYVATQREAIARGTEGVSIESVMGPGIRRSVGWGAVGAASVVCAGLLCARATRR